MSAFLFALVAAALTSIGSRDQLLLAELSTGLGKGRALLATALVATAATTALAAWAGSAIAAILPAAAKSMLVAIALVLSAIELAWPRRPARPQEPTRSLGAIALVLTAWQLTDAARFLVFALAAAFAPPSLVAGGGFVGAGAALVAGWLGRRDLAVLPLVVVRRVLAAALLVTGIIIGLSARNLL